MAVVEQLLCEGEGGAINFGNHLLEAKAKVEDFPCCGDLYKVKTFKTMTKLEKNGMFLYESVPGTSVNGFKETDEGINFKVEGANMWQRFNQKDEKVQAWYYRSIADLTERLSHTSAWIEYKTLTELVFGKGE